MTIEYKYMLSHGDICTCESCEAEAPLAWFDTGFPRTKKKICEVCATTTIGRITEYAPRDPAAMQRRDDLKIMAQVANHLLDKLTPRLADQANAVFVPDEAA